MLVTQTNIYYTPQRSHNDQQDNQVLSTSKIQRSRRRLKKLSQEKLNEEKNEKRSDSTEQVDHDTNNKFLCPYCETESFQVSKFNLFFDI